MKDIIWVASYPKSGNTWIRMFMSAFLTGRGDVDINKPTFAELDDILPHHHQAVTPLALDSLDDEAIALIRGAALMHMVSGNTSPMLVKTHHANAVINGSPMIPTYLTHSAIYIVRDPRDVLVSFARHNQLDDLGLAAEIMLDPLHISRRGTLYHYLSSWNEHVKSWTKATNVRVHVVRYEDLWEDPETGFRGILEALKVPAIDPGLLADSAFNTSFEILKLQEDDKGFNEWKDAPGQFFTTGTPGVWRDVLADRERERIETECAEMMVAHGYLDRGELPAKVEAAE